MTNTEIEYEMRDELRQLELDEVGSDDVELGMVIDLQRCTGCGACNLACKNENNVQEGHAWSSRISRTTGTFPNVTWEYVPTLCNHCADAPCVNGCPTEAMYKGPGGITMHDPEACIGCKYCIVNCPYDVISFNEGETHEFWRDDEAAMEGLTATPEETAEAAGGEVMPYDNPNRETAEHEDPHRYKGVVEKCTFCYHRVREGELPACVEACPSDARIFGDLNDPESKVSELVSTYSSKRRKEEKGTEPKVHYVRDFNGGGYERSKGSVDDLARGD